MRLLIDTHTFIWWDTDTTQLSSRALALCNDPMNTMVLSLASVWEMQIKLQKGTLHLKVPLVEMIKKQQQLNDLELLPISLSHILELSNLPTLSHHKDPFDRIMIAQAVVEHLPIVSADPFFPNYPINLLW